MAEKRLISWEGIMQAAHLVKLECDRAEFRPTHILAVGRGGMVPAGILAYDMIIPFVGAINPIFGKYSNWGEVDPALTLIVDDIVDTGETLKKIRSHCPISKFASLYYREGCLVKPDFYGIQISKKAPWITFPYAPNDGSTVGRGKIAV